MSYYPRSRASYLVPRVNYALRDRPGLAAIVGFKLGMGHMLITDDRQRSPNFGKPLFVPFTAVALPPLLVADSRVYVERDGYLINVGRYSDSLDKGEISQVRAVISVVPKDAGFSQKKPIVIEVPLGGSIDEQIGFIKENSGKKLEQADLLRGWSYVDVTGVTKGKGFQGPVKRFGIKRKQHKSRKTVRVVGTLGPWHPADVMFTVPMAGQLGFQRRTTYNLRVLYVSSEPGFSFSFKKGPSHYAFISGSLPGAKGRPLLIRRAVRMPVEAKMPSIIQVSLEGVKL